MAPRRRKQKSSSKSYNAKAKRRSMSESAYIKRLESSAKYLDKRFSCTPRVAIVLGSGMGSISSIIENAVVVPFQKVPGLLPRGYSAQIEGHKKEFVFGKLSGVPVVVQSGRVHMHEALSSADAALPVRALAHIGVSTFIITNAAGGLNPEMKVGDLMVLTNHLSFGVADPSLGIEHPAIGSKFYDVSHSFDQELITLACDQAPQAGFKTHRGAYLMKVGPAYETAAEIAFLAAIGKMVRESGQGDLAVSAVGMSTAPEVHALRNYSTIAPNRILGLSLITNLAAGISKTLLSHEEVQDAGRAAEPKIKDLIRRIVSRL